MSTSPGGVRAILNEERNQTVLEQFFRYAIAIAVLPLALFFVVRNILRMDAVSYNQFGSPDIIAGLCAACCVQLIAGIFAYSALVDTSCSNLRQDSRSLAAKTR